MQGQELPMVEGLSPAILWYTFVGIVCLAGVFLIFTKVADWFRERRERKERKLPAESDKLAEEISAKVMERIGPHLEEIDRKLSSDKELIDSHTRQINALSHAYEDVQDGASVQSLALVAILGNILNGGENKADIQRAMTELNKYLAKRHVYITHDGNN